MIPDESTRRQELEAGSIDGYDLPNPVDWAGLEDDGNSVEVRDPFNILYLGLNPEAQPAAQGPQGPPGALLRAQPRRSWSRPSCPRVPRSRRSSCPTP